MEGGPLSLVAHEAHGVPATDPGGESSKAQDPGDKDEVLVPLAGEWKAGGSGSKRRFERDEGWGAANREARNVKGGEVNHAWQRDGGGSDLNTGWRDGRSQQPRPTPPPGAPGEAELKVSDPPKPDNLKVPTTKRNLPNQAGLVATSKEARDNADPPVAPSNPPSGGGGSGNYKGKKVMESDSQEDGCSDEGGKVDIPDYFDDLSGEEDGEMSKRTYVSVHPVERSDEVMLSVKVNPVEDMDWEKSLAIVPFTPSAYVEMLVTADLDGTLPSVENDEKSVVVGEKTEMGKKVAIKTYKKPRKTKGPVIAQRKSSRIKRDGIPITVKAQQRKNKQDEMIDAGINLGENEDDRTANISFLKAKERAQALVSLAKEQQLTSNAPSSSSDPCSTGGLVTGPANVGDGGVPTLEFGGDGVCENDKWVNKPQHVLI
ncbi:hypothetical protein GUJ93_ZPchr0006g42024 [Zizania palustris]|uniref:Uncharacterized protein n=1 Tax=Zizania palustris TaxID=103762 RepID=A0A8J5VMG1_ZIZPA|nr:hypothetical protein GUJ93_ZPchr0006g42024 [Zizania palustris]